MIYQPITRKEAEYLYQYDYPGQWPYTFGCILRRLVYAGAKPEANATLDGLSGLFEKFMTTTKARDMEDPEQLGREWMNASEKYYDNLFKEATL